MRSPRTATASAMLNRSSTVMILPLVRMRSGAEVVAGPAAPEPCAEAGCCARITEAPAIATTTPTAAAMFRVCRGICFSLETRENGGYGGNGGNGFTRRNGATGANGHADRRYRRGVLEAPGSPFVSVPPLLRVNPFPPPPPLTQRVDVVAAASYTILPPTIVITDVMSLI